MIDWKFEDIDKLRRAYDPKIVDRAHRSSIRKTTSKLRTFVSSAVRDRYTITARAIAKAVSLKVFRQGDKPVGVLSYFGHKIGLFNFQARGRNIKTGAGRRRGVSVRVRKGEGRKVVTSQPAFIAEGANSNKHVFARTTNSRFPIVSLKGPSIPEMVGRRKLQGEANEFIAVEHPRIFNNEMNFFLDRSVGLK